MPILASLALVSGVAILVRLREHVQSCSFLFSALGLGFLGVTLGITFAVNVPINIAGVNWSVANPPDEMIGWSSAIAGSRPIRSEPLPRFWRYGADPSPTSVGMRVGMRSLTFPAPIAHPLTPLPKWARGQSGDNLGFRPPP